VGTPLKPPPPPKRGAPRPSFPAPPPQPYSATEVDGWQHKLSRVSQNRAAVHACRPAPSSTRQLGTATIDEKLVPTSPWGTWGVLRSGPRSLGKSDSNGAAGTAAAALNEGHGDDQARPTR